MNMKKAAVINGLGKYSKIILSLIVNAILARILSAEDYGIVAVITVFSTFFTTISDMGFGTAIIQNKELSKKDIDNIYSFTVYMSIVLMLIFFLCSFPISWFYNNKIYINLGILLSIALLFNALNMVPNGILNRDKRFIDIALRTVIVYIISAIFTVILAFCGFRYYALAVQSILTALFTFLWNYITTKPQFILKFNIHSINKIMSYSGYQFAFNVVNYFSRNLDNLLTGKVMGNTELGYYNKAYSLMLYPVNNLTGVISPVLHPIMSEYQKNKEVIYTKYMKIVRLLALIGLYVAPLCFLAADEMITILYGNGWAESVQCFKYLSLAIIPQMINSSAGAIFQAIGNTKLLFLNSCINTGVTVIAILYGVFIGRSIESLAMCVAFAYILHFISAFFMLLKYGFNYKITNFIHELLPEVLILVIMIMAIFLYPFDNSQTVYSFLLKALYLGVAYFAAVFLSKENQLYISVFHK